MDKPAKANKFFLDFPDDRKNEMLRTSTRAFWRSGYGKRILGLYRAAAGSRSCLPYFVIPTPISGDASELGYNRRHSEKSINTIKA